MEGNMILLFLVVYFIITRVVIASFVILFRQTGLKGEVSRFQVISMMTGTGFTTGESELILGHPIRRKLAAFLISYGAFSLAVIISSISQILSKGLGMTEILTAAAVVFIIYCTLRVKGIQRVLSKWFNRELKHHVELADMPIRDLFLKNKQDTLLNLHLYKESQLADSSLGQLADSRDSADFVVLFIERGDVMIRKNIYDTTLQEGDQLFLFGRKTVIHQIFAHDLKLMGEKQKELRQRSGEI
jgi:hypothetical protein